MFYSKADVSAQLSLAVQRRVLICLIVCCNCHLSELNEDEIIFATTTQIRITCLSVTEFSEHWSVWSGWRQRLRRTHHVQPHVELAHDVQLQQQHTQVSPHHRLHHHHCHMIQRVNMQSIPGLTYCTSINENLKNNQENLDKIITQSSSVRSAICIYLVSCLLFVGFLPAMVFKIIEEHGFNDRWQWLYILYIKF